MIRRGYSSEARIIPIAVRTATWISSTGSTVDAVTACDPTVLTNGSSKAFSLTSKIPIPPAAVARLRVDATSTLARPWQTVAYEAPSP